MEDLNRLHAELPERSHNDGFAAGRIEVSPKNAPWHGMREFHVWAPAGNFIGFGSRI